MATRQKLPNLKICVDNTDSTDDSDVEVQESESSSSDDEDTIEVGGNQQRRTKSTDHVYDDDNVLAVGSTAPTERRFLSKDALANQRPASNKPYGPRVYENKYGPFVTGVDLLSEDAAGKREKRAERFGTISNPKQPITDVDLKNLYKSLGINMENISEDPRGWRLEVVMLRGTENMSTKDVFDYFSEFGPKGVEWIDDYSCNVLWVDKLTPARALLKLSSSFTEVQVAERIVDGKMEALEGAEKSKSQSKGDERKNTAKAAEDVENPTKPTPAPKEISSPPRPVVLDTMADESMEFDDDVDNIDLMADDPIDQAISTWTNFSKNRKQRTEREELKKQAIKEVKGSQRKDNARKETEHKENAGGLSEKEKRSEKISEKESNEAEEEDSMVDADMNVANNAMEVDVDEKKGSSKSKGKLKEKEIKQEDNRNSKEEKNSRGKSKSKADKDVVVIKTEMDEDIGSESDCSSSSSSSSSSSDSSSSDSSSDSDSGSSSSSSSSSSDSSSRASGNESDGSRKKKKKSKSERDHEREVKKMKKKPSEPPLPAPTQDHQSDIPWPPGWWRLGNPHSKADYLFLRYAMKADKKMPGAEKKSQYYVKHGNPNFGGMKGIITNSRKRQLRNYEYREEREKLSASPDRQYEQNRPMAISRSRLAGRLGTKDGAEKRPEISVDKNKDLRGFLNKDITTIHSDPAPVCDSDDEMDYGAELEKLMGAGEPPTKKRFMRMHADDEEELALARKRSKAQAALQRKISQLDEEEYEDDFHDDGGEGDSETDNRASPPRRKQWVDYDNVEDDDPFNLFGTSQQKPAPVELETTDNYNDTEAYHGSDGLSVKERLSHRPRGNADVKGRLAQAGDLRAKLQNRRKMGNRNW